MKIRGRIYRDNKSVSDALSDAEAQKASDVHDWTAILDDICKKLDLSRPVILKKHEKELERFSRTVFRPSDFMESVDFDKFELTIYLEKKRENQHN